MPVNDIDVANYELCSFIKYLNPWIDEFNTHTQIHDQFRLCYISSLIYVRTFVLLTKNHSTCERI